MFIEIYCYTYNIVQNYECKYCKISQKFFIFSNLYVNLCGILFSIKVVCIN